MSATPSESCVDVGDGGRDEGAILIIVLGALLVLSAIASSAMLATRADLKSRFERNRHVELALLADGIVRLSAYRLVARRPDLSAPPVDGTPMVCGVGDVMVELRIADVAGLVDLNAAPQQLIERTLLGAGAAPALAKTLAARIEDFRDADETDTDGGAETASYLAAGLGHGTKNAPFDTVGELDQVLGMPSELLQALMPLVTVHSRTAGIDPAVAPIEVLRALSSRHDGTFDPELSPAILPRERYLVPSAITQRSTSRAFRIDVRAARGNARFARSVVVEVIPQSEVGYAVQSWSAGALGPERAAALPASTPCFVAD